MKKIIITLILTLTLGFVAAQVWAWGGWGCPMAAGYGKDISPETYQKFIDDTAQLRLDLAAKQGEYEAVLAHSNPDPKQAGQIAREIAEIQAKIQARAKENGLPAWGCCRGLGKGKMGGKYGYGQQYHGKCPRQ